MNIKLRNRRIDRKGYWRWSKPKGAKNPTLTPAGGTSGVDPLYPPYVTPVDYDFTEVWKQDGDVWRPGPLTVTTSNPTAVTEWRVVTDPSAFIAAVSLPELAQAAGFPAAVFVSVSLAHTSNDSGIDPAGQWALNIDVTDLLDDAVISPVSSYLGRNGVYFAAYVKGIVKSLELPVLRLALSAFWTTTGFTTFSGYLQSLVSASSPFIESLPSNLEVKEDVVCSRCRCGEDGWVHLAPVSPVP